MLEPSEPAARLSVNVDHVATLRQARRATYPDPVAAAAMAEDAGAQGITVHLRADRRHIQEADVEQLRERITGKLNLEIAATPEMLAVAERVRPHQVTLVPERADEITTEGGLDLRRQVRRIADALIRLERAGIATSLFLDPEPAMLDELRELGPLQGFEINTDRYTRARGEAVARELAKIASTAERGAAAGLRVYAGHGLTCDNVGAVARLPEVEELNIGHSIVSRAVLVGLAAAVSEMLAAIRAGRSPGPLRG